MVRPSNLTDPDVIGSRPSTQRSNVVLPQPDSPTSATTSPRRTSRLTPSTARTGPCLLSNVTWTSSTASSGSSIGGPDVDARGPAASCTAPQHDVVRPALLDRHVAPWGERTSVG